MNLICKEYPINFYYPSGYGFKSSLSTIKYSNTEDLMKELDVSSFMERVNDFVNFFSSTREELEMWIQDD